MRKWEAVLRRDSAAWDDFKLWLHELELQETAGLVDTAPDMIAHMQGRVHGIRKVYYTATVNEREEVDRARSRS
jgi:hypothetical protein